MTGRRPVRRALAGRRPAAAAALALCLATFAAGCGGESGNPLARPDDEAVALREAANAICREAGNPLDGTQDEDGRDRGWFRLAGMVELQRDAQRRLGALEASAPAWMDERYAEFVEARRELVLIARAMEPVGGMNFTQVFVDEDPEYARLADELGLDDCAR